MSATLVRAESTQRAHVIASQALISRLLHVHAELADARAVARQHGLTRCSDDLTQQIAATAQQIQIIVHDLSQDTP
jgi:hypothetical protein